MTEKETETKFNLIHEGKQIFSVFKLTTLMVKSHF